MSSCAYKCFTYSKVTYKNSLELGSFQVTWQSSVTHTLSSAEALYVFLLHTYAELGMIYACKLNPSLPLTPGLAVLLRRKGNISQAEYVFTALRHSWRHGGKGCYWIAHAINYSPEMGLDCTAREHTPQQISREAATLACTGGRQALSWASHRGITRASYSKHRNKILKKEN